LLRSYVTHSSARLAAIEARPVGSQRGSLETILQRGNRFLKQFRQRLARALSIQTTERTIHETKSTEQQRTTARGVSV